MYLATVGLAGAAELDLDILAKTAGVVVAHGLGVAKGLEQRIGLEDDVFHTLRGFVMRGAR